MVRADGRAVAFLLAFRSLGNMRLRGTWAGVGVRVGVRARVRDRVQNEARVSTLQLGEDAAAGRTVEGARLWGACMWWGECSPPLSEYVRAEGRFRGACIMWRSSSPQCLPERVRAAHRLRGECTWLWWRGYPRAMRGHNEKKGPRRQCAGPPALVSGWE